MKTHTLSVTGLAHRIYNLYKPYFSLSGERSKHSFMLGAMIAGNVAATYLMSLIQTAFTAFTGILLQPIITYTLIFRSCVTVSLLMGGWAGLMVVTHWIGQTLGMSLANELHQKITRQWLETGAYYGLTTLNPEKTPLNPEEVLSHDIPELTGHIIGLVNMSLSIIGNFVVGMAGLYTLSNTLTFTVASVTFAIPGYMLLATIGYAVGFDAITSYFGNSLMKEDDKLKEQDGITNHHIHHVHTHRDEIAFKKGVSFEKSALLGSLGKSAMLQKITLAIRSKLMLISEFQRQFSWIIGYIIASPSIIAGKIAKEEIFTVGNYFSLATGLFTFKSDNYSELADSDVMLGRIEKFQAKINLWEKQCAENQHY